MIITTLCSSSPSWSTWPITKTQNKDEGQLENEENMHIIPLQALNTCSVNISATKVLFCLKFDFLRMQQ